MPVNVVKTPRDEHLWEKAKSQAAKQGHQEDWDYVMGVFQRMKGRTGGSKEGSVKKLYDVNPPISMRSSLMTRGPFFVPDTSAGLKTAAFLDDCSRDEKISLFKVAVERDTSDLSDAYVSMKKKMEDKDIELDDNEYDSTEPSSFVFPAGSMLENEHKADVDSEADEDVDSEADED